MSSTYPWLAKYEKGVPPTVTIPDVPVQQLLIDAAAKYPDKLGVRLVLKYLPLGIAVQAKMTYRELNRQSDQLAAALASLGVGKGSHVAIMLPNMPQEIIAYFGILKAGATIVLIEHNLGEVIRVCQRLVVLDNGRKIADGPHSRRCKCRRLRGPGTCRFDRNTPAAHHPLTHRRSRQEPPRGNRSGGYPLFQVISDCLQKSPGNGAFFMVSLPPCFFHR